MFSNLKVEFTPPECAFEVLKFIASQNKEVTLLVDEAGNIVISADMSDYNRRAAEYED